MPLRSGTPPATPSPVQRYGLAVAASALGLLIGLALAPFMQAGLFNLFLGAVVLATWYGGLGPGLLATLLSALAIDFFLEEPSHTLAITSLSTAVEIVVFLLVALLTSSLNTQLREARRRAEAARAEAEAARRRAEFLAGASDQLASSLDYPTTLGRVAQLAVPTMADWCIVYLATGTDQPRAVELVASDSVDQTLLRQLVEARERQPRRESFPLDAVFRSGRSQLVPRISDAWIAAVSADSQHAEALRALGSRSLMIVPLRARSQTIGAIAFGSTRPGRSYDAADLSFAQELANRCALAVENARLHRDVQQSVRTRDEFLAAAAHDLKNPLALIKGVSQLLRRRVARADTLDRAPIDDDLRSIDETATRMARLIDELLDATRLQMGQPLDLLRRPTDLVALARHAAAEAQRASSHHQIRVEAAVEELIGEWDPARLERVLGNLLSNAVKYSPDGGEVTLALAREDRDDGAWAVLSVHDDGVGIPTEDLPRVFERFHRGENVIGKISGTGVGLASVRQIVEQHGGTIAVQSREGQGSTFTVRLPALRSSRNAGDLLRPSGDPGALVGGVQRIGRDRPD